MKVRARLYVRVLPFWAPCIQAQDVWIHEQLPIAQVVHSLRSVFGLSEKQVWVEFE